MLMLAHALDKGALLPGPRRMYGSEKAAALIRLVARYRQHGSRGCILALVEDALRRYQAVIEPLDAQAAARTQTQIEALFPVGQVGIETLAATDADFPVRFPSPEAEAFWKLAYARRSQRIYSERDVDAAMLVRACAVARRSPSVCNRQTSRVHVYRDKARIKAILDTQLGDQNWCMGASRLLVITGVLDYFGGYYERSQVFVDGGMFAMSLVFGLQAEGLATCCKMAIRNYGGDRAARRAGEIPDNEELILLVLVGHPPAETAPLPPPSVRLPSEHFIVFHEA